MFNIIEKNQKLVKGIMIVITATFVIWGIGGYLGSMGDDGYIAKVGNLKIYNRDIDQVIQENPKNSDKMQILYSLINRDLLLENMHKLRMQATNTELQQEIAKIPLFQESGTFSLVRYQNFLRTKFITAEEFQQQISEQVLVNQMVSFFNDSYFNSELFNKQFVNLLSRERNVVSYTLKANTYLPQVNVSESEIKGAYQQNIKYFTKPEQVKLQYLTLNPDAVAKLITIPEPEINNYITKNFKTLINNEIDASHILFTIPSNASVATKASIKANALKVLALVKAHPNDFAKYAREYSNDPVSAKNGGNLGFFARGVMVKPFENIAFGLKPNQISDLVQTEFGYHIIRVNAVKTATPEMMRKNAITALSKQKVTHDFQKYVDQLNDLTYNQPKSLEPAAKKLGLTLQTSDWVSATTNNSTFTNSKVQKAIFTPDVTKSHNNSEMVNLGNNTYQVFRATDYMPQHVESLALVHDKIATQIKRQKASQLAGIEGQKDLTALQQGKLKITFSSPQTINLLGGAKDTNPNATKQIFAINITNNKPNYTGVINNDGDFVIYKVLNETINNDLVQQNKELLAQIAKSNAMLNLEFYIASIKNNFKVTYNVSHLNTINNSNNNQD